MHRHACTKKEFCLKVKKNQLIKEVLKCFSYILYIYVSVINNEIRTFVTPLIKRNHTLRKKERLHNDWQSEEERQKTREGEEETSALGKEGVGSSVSHWTRLASAVSKRSSELFDIYCHFWERDFIVDFLCYFKQSYFNIQDDFQRTSSDVDPRSGPFRNVRWVLVPSKDEC